MSLSVNLSLGLQWTHTKVQDLNTANDNNNYSFTDSLADGVAVDQADVIWHDRRTLNANDETLDLTASLTNAFGTSVTFAKIKGITIVNRQTESGRNLTVGGAPTAPLNIGTMVVGPGGMRQIWEPSAAGIAVGANDQLLIDSGASSIVYDIVIAGTSA